MTDTRFEAFELAEPLLRGVREAGFAQCTPIQAEALPIALSGRDVAGQAQTGTGKTAAYLIALFNRLLVLAPREDREANQPRALVVAPTRELAVQIHKDAEALGKHCGFTIGLVYGGEAYEQQRTMLANGVDVLIGTPGRLIDYFKQRIFNLKAAQAVVLDEADRMFDMGFIKDIRFLLRRLPPPTERLSMLFSATLSYRVLELAYEHMNNAASVDIEPEKVAADNVRQTLYMPAAREKINLLIGLLRHLEPERAMVFINTKRMADKLVAYLEGNGFNADVLSGDVRQKKRLRLLGRFESGELPILVTTDVASRGLHIPAVSHVFNYDLPQDAEDYVHRIGRTARAGATGEAISFACEQYAFSLPDIEDFIGQAIPKVQIEKAILADIAPPAPRRKRRQGRSEPRKRRSGGRRNRS